MTEQSNMLPVEETTVRVLLTPTNEFVIALCNSIENSEYMSLVLPFKLSVDRNGFNKKQPKLKIDYSPWEPICYTKNSIVALKRSSIHSMQLPNDSIYKEYYKIVEKEEGLHLLKNKYVEQEQEG